MTRHFPKCTDVLCAASPSSSPLPFSSPSPSQYSQAPPSFPPSPGTCPPGASSPHHNHPLRQIPGRQARPHGTLALCLKLHKCHCNHSFLTVLECTHPWIIHTFHRLSHPIGAPLCMTPCTGTGVSLASCVQADGCRDSQRLRHMAAAPMTWAMDSH